MFRTSLCHFLSHRFIDYLALFYLKGIFCSIALKLGNKKIQEPM